MLWHSIVLCQELSYTHYTKFDGLPSMYVEDLYKDSIGNLWIATRGGISRFNGYDFDNFDDIPNKPKNAYKILQVGTDMVFLSSDGLYFFDGIEFKLYPKPEGATFNPNSKLFLNSKGELWCRQGSQKNPLIFFEGQYYEIREFYPDLADKEINHVSYHQPSESIILNFKGEGLFALRENKAKLIFETKEPTPKYFFSDKLKGAEDRKYYFRNHLERETVFYRVSNDLKIREIFRELDGDIVEIHEPFPSDLVIVSRFSQNLNIYKKGTQEVTTLIDDLPSRFNYPGMPYLDDSKNIYLESDKGIIIINANKFIKYDENALPNIWSILENSAGEMLFGGYSTGVKKMVSADKLVTVESEKVEYCKNLIFSQQAARIYMGATLDLNGTPIFPCETGLLKIEENKLKLFDYPENCSGTMASLFVYTDIKNERILSATCQGLRILDKDGNLLKIVHEGLFKHRCLLTIAQDKTDNYWTGGTGGLAKYNYKTDQIDNYTLENKKLPFGGVICTIIDSKGTLWAGSKEGLAYYDQQADKFISKDEFQGMSISSMLADKALDLFMHTDHGLIKCNLEDHYNGIEINQIVYDKNNGFKSIVGPQNSLFKDSKGFIWVCTSTQVFKFHPDNLNDNIAIPNVQISKINQRRLNHKSRLESMQIHQDTNSLDIEFESIGLNASNNINYSYKLEGQDDEWSDYNQFKNCSYRNLSSGEYIFKVKNNHSDKIITQSITIDIPFYKEPYFGGLAVISCLGLLLLTFNYARSNNVEKENNKLLRAQEQQLLIEQKQLKEINQLEVENKKLLQIQNDKLVFQKDELSAVNSKLVEEIKSIKKIKLNINQKIEIKTKGNTKLISPKELMYIRAEENGCRYYIKDQNSIWNDEKLKVWVSQLDPHLFVRIHRSIIVQKAFIATVSYESLSLLDGTELSIGRTYKRNLQ